MVRRFGAFQDGTFFWNFNKRGVMRHAFERMAIAILVLLTAAIWQSLDAQTRQQQFEAERAKTTAAGKVKACTLLTNAEIKEQTGRDQAWELNDEPYDMGSACDYGGGTVTLRVYSGSKPEDEVNWTLKNYKVDDQKKHPISGFGAGAYVIYYTPQNKYQDVAAILVGRAGVRMFMLSLSAPEGKSAESVQPQLIDLGKTVAARLK